MNHHFTGQHLASVSQLLAAPKKVVITTHYKPDGDALGSALGLYHFLIQTGHQVTVIVPSDYPDFLFWLPGNKEVINYQQQPAKADLLIEEAELIFCLDFNSSNRIEAMEKPVLGSKAIKILIDHHLDPKDFCNFNFTFPKAAATCELIYYFICALGEEKRLNAAIADSLYTGIMTDTGSFRFPSMTADLHRVIASLIDAGARNSYIHERIYDDFTENRLRLLGYCINEKLTVIPQFHSAYVALSERELNKFHFKTGDTEGVVNYGLGIKGIKLSAFFSEKQGLIKISFRSRDDFSVKELAEEHFSGGGHKNAAGGKSLLSLQQTVDKFIALLPGLKTGN